MTKCPFCKEEIQDGAVKCKHCGEILNNTAYAEAHATPSQGSSGTIQIPISGGRLMQIVRRKVAPPLAFFALLCVAFNAPRPDLVGACFEGNRDELCHARTVGPLMLHLHTYSYYMGWCKDRNQQPFVLCHSPVFGMSLTGSGQKSNYEGIGGAGLPMIVMPIAGIVICIAFSAFWCRFANRQPHKAEIVGRLVVPFTPLLVCIAFEALLVCGEFQSGIIIAAGLATIGSLLWGAVYVMRQIKEIKNTNTPEALRGKKVLMFRFRFNELALAEKIILGSAVVATMSLFLPWVAMGIISSSGWNQQGYLFLLLFVYPVIGVFNVNGLNRVAGIVCGVLALVISIWYIADKHYEIMGNSGNASASGLYLFAASTIGVIVGGLKYKRHAAATPGVVLPHIQKAVQDPSA